MAGEVKHMKLDEVTWSPHQLPLFELVAKFPLPFLAKSTKTSSSSSDDGSGGGRGRVLAGEIYRMQRLIRVHKVHVKLLQAISNRLEGNTRSSDMRKSPRALELSIPKDYQGPFQILPYGKDTSRAMTIKDIMMSMPRFIKVLETAQRKPHEVQLVAGDVLEVLGTTKRSTKAGVIEFLRLQKAHREFVLHPNFEGKFQSLEDRTEYSLAEILGRFPLPQKVSLTKPELHSEMLLNKLSMEQQRGEESFLLMRESQEEYVIGADIGGQDGVLIHMDADVDFHLPDWVTPTCAGTNENDTIHRILKKGKQSVGDLSVDQVICRVNEKLILCKPWEKLFKDPPPVLPVRRLPGMTTDGESQLNPLIYDSVTTDEKVNNNDGQVANNGHLNVVQGSVDAIVNNTTLEKETTSTKSKQEHERDTIPRRTGIITSPWRSDNPVPPYANIVPVPPERKFDHVHVPPLPKARTQNRASDDVPLYAASYNLPAYDDAFGPSKVNPQRPLQRRTPDNTLVVKDVDDPKYVDGTPDTRISRIFKNSVHGVERKHMPSPDKPEPLPRQSFTTEHIGRDGGMKKVKIRRQRPYSQEVCVPTTLPMCPITPPAFKDAHLSLSKVLDKAEAVTRIASPKEEAGLPLPDICHETYTENNHYDCIKERPHLPETQQQLKRLTVDQVVDVLKALKLSSEVQRIFREHDIDGELFCSLDQKLLQTEFDLSQYHALKIVKFINGWRPKADKRISSLV